MKKILMIAAAIGLTLGACKKDVKEIGTPGSKMDGIKAHWELSKAVQVDELSLTKEAANIFGYFTSATKLPNITFSDSTFAVDTAGLGYNFFGAATGKWAFDDVQFPSSVTFTPDGASAFTLKLNGPIRPVDNLRFTKEIHKTCKTKPTWVMSYNIEFTRK